MNSRNMKIIAALVIVILAIILVSIVVGKDAEAPSEQNTSSKQTDLEQTNEAEGDLQMQPDINNQEFRLTASNISCSTSTINGVASHSCSGNIRVVPVDQPGREPGLYKINEQTKLLHEGEEQDINSLQQLSQANTIVQLKLADGSEDMLAEIRY